MYSRKPLSPWMVMRTLSILLIGPSAAVLGQEYHPIIEDRVEAGAAQVPLASGEKEHRGGWDLAVVISAAYNDNIFLSKSRPRADMVFQLAPMVAYTKGDDKGEGGFHLKAAYRPTAVAYVDNGKENRIDQQAVINAGWQGKAIRITYDGVFQQLGDATPDTGSPTDRLETSNEVRATWTPREKLAVDVMAGDRRISYSDPAYYDSDRTYGGVALRYVYSPKTELGIVTSIGRLKVEGANTQDTQRIAGTFAWLPREKIRIAIEAGAEHRKVDDSSSWSPVLKGRIEWRPRQGTDLYLAGYMQQEASAYYAGQNYQMNGFVAGISQRLSDHWTVKLDGGYERNIYEVVTGGGSGGRKDNIWFLRPALVRSVGEKSDLSIFYRIADDSSNEPDFGYNQQLLGIEYNHKF